MGGSGGGGGGGVYRCTCLQQQQQLSGDAHHDVGENEVSASGGSADRVKNELIELTDGAESRDCDGQTQQLRSCRRRRGTGYLPSAREGFGAGRRSCVRFYGKPCKQLFNGGGGHNNNNNNHTERHAATRTFRTA